MAKSSYLDNLINDRLPTNKNRYLSDLWEDYGTNTYSSYRNVALDSLTNEKYITMMTSDYLNNMENNQAVTDMQNPELSTITLDKRYLPIDYRRTVNRGRAEDFTKVVETIKHPPEYLPARITSVKGSSIRTIPILFPVSFSRSISASFAKENPVGSDKPIMAYSYTDAEEIPFEFDALVDYLPESYNSLRAYVDDIISILKPGKTNNIIHEPTVIVEFADMYFKGICTSVSVSYDNVYGYKSFVHARISCQFTRLG